MMDPWPCAALKSPGKVCGRAGGWGGRSSGGTLLLPLPAVEGGQGESWQGESCGTLAGGLMGSLVASNSRNAFSGGWKFEMKGLAGPPPLCHLSGMLPTWASFWWPQACQRLHPHPHSHRRPLSIHILVGQQSSGMRAHLVSPGCLRQRPDFPGRPHAQVPWLGF